MSRTVAIVALLLLVTGCTATPLGDDDARSARVGEVFPDELTGDIQGHHSYVVVPGLRYDFTVSEPGERMDSITADEAGVDDEAGDDVRFVGITWDLEGQLGDTFVMEPEQQPRQLSLIVDGEPMEVGDLGEEGFHGVYVTVPADTEDIGLSVEYDGLTQTVEDAYDVVMSRPLEPAALYLDVPAVDWRSCPEAELAGDDARLSFWGTDCTARVSSSLPYFGPLGWAPEGSAWVVVDLDLPQANAGIEVGEGPYDYVDYDVTTSVRLTLGGRSPAHLLPAEGEVRAGEQDDGSYAARAVFRVGVSDGDDALRLVRRYRGTPDEEDLPADVPAEIRRTQRVELS